MLEIRCYVDDDLDEVVTLWYRSWTNAFPNLKHPQSFEEWKLRWQNDIAKRGNVWVAQAQSRIVGFIVITEAVGIIEQIFVDVDTQRMGVGSALLNKAKSICPHGLSLTTLQQNMQARQFYEKHGFVAKRLGINPINRQPNIEYVWNPREAAKNMESYLQVSEIIDWQHSTIVELAHRIAAGCETTEAIALACFEWVRDEIYHSYDYQMNPVTCRASDVLKYKTGYCYAKSHLLAALLRANSIPAGFCYQRLSIDDKGAPYSLHGFNAVYLPEVGWYRVDARGNRQGVNAQFTPPLEQLAFKIQFPEEADFQDIFPEPLRVVVEALQAHGTWDDLLSHLPDVSLPQG